MFINWPFILVVWTAFVVVAFCFLTNCLINLQFCVCFLMQAILLDSGLNCPSGGWWVVIGWFWSVFVLKKHFFSNGVSVSLIYLLYIFFLNISIYMLLQYIVCCLCLMSFQRRKSVALPGALTLLHHDSNLSHCIWFLTNVLNSRLENKQMCI